VPELMAQVDTRHKIVVNLWLILSSIGRPGPRSASSSGVEMASDREVAACRRLAQHETIFYELN